MSNDQPIEKRFFFHGNAVALAAHVRRPEDFFIESVASSCLPATGGLAQANVGKQSYKDIISFESAYTRASGDFADARRAVEFTNGNHGQNGLPTNTFVESSVKGLNIREGIVPGTEPIKAPASIVVGQLYARQESTSDRRNPVSFRSLEISIDGVVVNGQALKVSTDPQLFSQNDTYEKLKAAYEGSSDFQKAYGRQFFPAQADQPGALARLFGSKPKTSFKETIYATVVTGLAWEGKAPAGVSVQGNRVTIEGIGSIYFGEFQIEPDFRRLTMLRFQLGSPYGGDGSACEVQSNGSWWPPEDVGTQ